MSTRKERGLCSSCNNPPRPGKTQCQPCADKAIERMKSARAEGICMQSGCYNETIDGAVRCPKCVKRRSNYDKEKREERNDLGLCTHCGAEHNEPTKLCEDCKLKYRKIADRRNFGGMRKEIVDLYQGKCACCKKDGQVVHHIDNSGITGPRDVTPNNSRDNLILLCRRCHADIHRLGGAVTRGTAIVLLREKSGGCSKGKKNKLSGWKKIRKEILTRDGNKCGLCSDSKRKLVVHHKDDCGLATNRPNNSPANLITLCKSCHNSITNLRAHSNIHLATKLIHALGPGTTGVRNTTSTPG